MQLLGMTEARERLDPFTEKLLVKPCLSAISDYNKFVAAMPGPAAAISSTTRAGMIHDWTARAVRGAMCEGAREVVAYGFFTIIVRDDLAVRYKYIAAGQPSNVATERQTLLARHCYDDDLMGALALDGVTTPPTLVTCGYKLGGDGRISSLIVQCDYGKTILWRYFVHGEPGVVGAYETLPLDPTNTLDTTIVRSSRKNERRTDRDAK